MEEGDRFLCHISKVSVVDVLEDKLRWEETRDGVFSVKSMYKALWPRIFQVFLMGFSLEVLCAAEICLFT